MKALLKKWFSDSMKGLGTTLVLITLVSLLPELFNISNEHRQFYFTFLVQLIRFFAITIPILSIIELSIMEFELFSKNKETRRKINIALCSCVVICTIGLFDLYPQPIRVLLTVITVIVAIISAIIAYIIKDRSEKQDVIDINQKLSEMNQK